MRPQHPAFRLPILAALLLFITLPTAAQTPEQRFFDWTTLPFEAEVYAERRARMMDLMAASGGGVFLIPGHHGVSDGTTFRQHDDVLYFSGLEVPHSVLALDADTRQALLFTPPRDARFASPSRPNDFPGRPLGDDPALRERTGLDAVLPYDSLTGTVAAWVAAGRALWLNAGRGGVETPQTDFVYDWNSGQRLRFHLQQAHPEATVRDAFPAVAQLRMVKGPEEVAVLRRVCSLTVEAIRTAAAHVRPGVDERTLEAVLEAVYKRGGAQRLAFSSIIKSGPNALWPWRILAAHYDRRNRTMDAGDLVIFDVGTEFDYYVSDVGRTFPVSGQFTDLQREKLTMSTAVADAVIAAIRPGVTFADLLAVAHAHIPADEQKYMQTGSFFGHHIGMNAGDPALLDAPLAPGMVFTVEPWYYNHDDGVSVFVEDVILVTDEGAEVLTAALPRAPEVLERMVAQREQQH